MSGEFCGHTFKVNSGTKKYGRGTKNYGSNRKKKPIFFFFLNRWFKSRFHRYGIGP